MVSLSQSVQWYQPRLTRPQLFQKWRFRCLRKSFVREEGVGEAKWKIQLTKVFLFSTQPDNVMPKWFSQKCCMRPIAADEDFAVRSVE